MSIAESAARAAIIRHTVTMSSAAPWRVFVRGNLTIADFPATLVTRGEFVVVLARDGGVTLAERTSDGRIHSCQCGRCPRALPVALAA